MCGHLLETGRPMFLACAAIASQSPLPRESTGAMIAPVRRVHLEARSQLLDDEAAGALEVLAVAGEAQALVRGFDAQRLDRLLQVGRRGRQAADERREDEPGARERTVGERQPDVEAAV